MRAEVGQPNETVQLMLELLFENVRGWHAHIHVQWAPSHCPPPPPVMMRGHVRVDRDLAFQVTARDLLWCGWEIRAGANGAGFRLWSGRSDGARVGVSHQLEFTARALSSARGECLRRRWRHLAAAAVCTVNTATCQ
jgi:hypothetical protein